ILPHLDSETLRTLLEDLSKMGVREVNDLMYIKEDDIRHLLPVVDCRKNTILIWFHAISAPYSHTAQYSTWTSTFQVPWDKTRPSLRTCIEHGQTPQETDRRHMVRVIVDAIREMCLNPTLSQCAVVAKSIIEQYPNSFEDRTDGGDRMGSGYFTLCSQLKTRVDNLNRNNTLARLRKPKRPAATVEYSHELPEGETRGHKGADRARVNDMQQLKTEWPFLFMKRFLMQHFSTLTGIDLESRLGESIAGKRRRVLQFFKGQLLRWKKEVRIVLADLERQPEDVDLSLALTLVMMAFFKDREDSIFLLADVRNSFIILSYVETQLSLSNTPRIILLGDSILASRKWMLATERKVVIEATHLQLDFTCALYQEEAATTLEFIQRFLVRINPENSKCTSRFHVSKSSGKTVQRKTMALNPHVASFIRDFTEYDWQNHYGKSIFNWENTYIFFVNLTG
uniref:Uncharacterized protein n=1 Tax=Paramormyrops kingsleyae TaxID=1676925 RepID=A0A3B3RGX0_9TELE